MPASRRGAVGAVKAARVRQIKASYRPFTRRRDTSAVAISKIFGLPAHPLFVHVPIVLIPLTAIGAIAIACSSRARERLGWLVLGIGIVAGLSTQLAIDSGEALQDSVRRSAALKDHIATADSIRPLILLLFLVALGVFLLGRSERKVAPAARAAIIVVTVLVAIGTNVRLFQIGHSGAKATWQQTQIRNEGDQARGTRSP
jgi:uncharacterized membrane protein